MIIESKILAFIKNHKLIIGALIVLIIYCVSTNISVITEDKIINHSIINPIGTTYEFGDVIGVETGFYGKNNFPLQGSIGEFYYYICLNDGTRTNIAYAAGSVNEILIQNYDTYKEIELIDNKLMKLGVNKISGMKYSKFSHLAKVYNDRFLGIIDNKPALQKSQTHS